MSARDWRAGVRTPGPLGCLHERTTIVCVSHHVTAAATLCPDVVTLRSARAAEAGVTGAVIVAPAACTSPETASLLFAAPVPLGGPGDVVGE